MNPYKHIEAIELSGFKKGMIKEEGRRLVKLIGFALHEAENIYYGHWQYILRKTLRPSGKSTSFLTPLTN